MSLEQKRLNDIAEAERECVLDHFYCFARHCSISWNTGMPFHPSAPQHLRTITPHTRTLGMVWLCATLYCRAELKALELQRVKQEKERAIAAKQEALDEAQRKVRSAALSLLLASMLFSSPPQHRKLRSYG